MERVSIFIDGNNFYFGLKKIYGKDKKLINFNLKEFCNFLAYKKEIMNIFYYNAPLDITKNLENTKTSRDSLIR